MTVVTGSTANLTSSTTQLSPVKKRSTARNSTDFSKSQKQRHSVMGIFSLLPGFRADKGEKHATNAATAAVAAAVQSNATESLPLSPATAPISSCFYIPDFPKLKNAEEWYQADEVQLVGELDLETTRPFYDDLDWVDKPGTNSGRFIRSQSSTALIRRTGGIRRRKEKQETLDTHSRTRSCHNLGMEDIRRFSYVIDKPLVRGFSSSVAHSTDCDSDGVLTPSTSLGTELEDVDDDDGCDDDDDDERDEVEDDERACWFAQKSPLPRLAWRKDVVPAIEPCHLHPHLSQYVPLGCAN